MVTYTCETCNKVFNRKSSYENHTERKKYPCVVKTLYFKTTQTVPNPPIQLIQKPIKIYKCTKCNYETVRTDNYNRHVKSCDINNEKISKEELLKKQEEEINKLSDQIKIILNANNKNIK